MKLNQFIIESFETFYWALQAVENRKIDILKIFNLKKNL